ncbi:hypothetical protein, partial [Arthrobacter bambusae]
VQAFASLGDLISHHLQRRIDCLHLCIGAPDRGESRLRGVESLCPEGCEQLQLLVRVPPGLGGEHKVRPWSVVRDGTRLPSSMGLNSGWMSTCCR